jgi:hypothetical protein
MPFALNITTKVPTMWFGPKGRNLATTVLLLGFYSAQSIDEFLDERLIKACLPSAIISTVLFPLCYLLIAERPDFSPTLSEEERFTRNKKTSQNFLQ